MATTDDLSDGLVPKSRTAAGQPVALGPGVSGTFHGDPAVLSKVVIEQPLVSARPDDFRDGLVAKPNKTNSTTTTTATTPPSSNSLVKPGEGVYQMKGRDGKIVPVSYSQVLSATRSGYSFADKKTLATFAADHAADPNNSENRSDATINAMSNWNPLKYLAAIGAGPLDVLQGVGGEALKVATAFDRPASTGGETEAQLAAATPNQNTGQSVGSLGEQVSELAVVPETKLAEAAKLGRVGTTLLKVGEQGARAATEQGAQSLVHSGGDTEQAKSAAEMGGIFGGGFAAAGEIAGPLNRFAKNILRHRFSVDEFVTGGEDKKVVDRTEQLVKNLRQANQKIDDDAADIHENNKAAIKKARDTGNEAEATRLEHDQVVAKQEAINAKRQNLTDAMAAARKAIQQRLQTMHDAARVYFRSAYSDLEKEAGAKAVPYADLAEDVHDALEKVKGSAESTRAFKDILSRARGVEEAEEAEGYSLEDLANLAPDEQARLRESLAEGGEENAAGATLSHLNGYYSELGRVVDSSATPGDVKQAARLLRERIDEHVKEMLGPDLYKKNLLVRNQYRTFAEGFKDYSGAAGSGSPIALSLKAKDPYHATQPFLGKSGRTSEVGRRVRGIIVGDAKDPATQFLGKDIADSYARGEDGHLEGQGDTTPAWRYRRQTAGLVDHLRNLQTGLDALEQKGSKAADLEKATQASAQRVEETRSAAREAANPKLEPTPAKETLSPAEVRQAKADALHAAAHNLGKYGLWVGIGGLASGTALFLKTGDLKHSLEVAGGGIAAGLFTPYLASKMLDQPGVVNALTTLSKKDLQQLMALPKDERTGVEEAIKQLADTAVRENRLKADKIPWLRIVGGTGARKVAGGGGGQTATPATLSTGMLPTTSTPSVMPLSDQQGAPQ